MSTKRFLYVLLAGVFRMFFVKGLTTMANRHQTRSCHGAMEVPVLGATQSHELATAELLAVKGGWMAKSAEGSNLRIAVVGATKEEALERFDGEVAAWARLREDVVLVP